MTKVLTTAPSAEVTRHEPASGPALASAALVRMPDEPRNPPFWQAEPCPAWCAVGVGAVGHTNGDNYGERDHAYFGPDIPLTMYEGSAADHAEPPCLSLSASQHYRAATPDVIVVVPVQNGWRSYAETPVHMTVAEARALRDGLDELLAGLDEADMLPGGVR